MARRGGGVFSVEYMAEMVDGYIYMPIRLNNNGHISVTQSSRDLFRNRQKKINLTLGWTNAATSGNIFLIIVNEESMGRM